MQVSKYGHVVDFNGTTVNVTLEQDKTQEGWHSLHFREVGRIASLLVVRGINIHELILVKNAKEKD